MPIDYLDPSRPTQVTVLGKQYVLWRDGSGEWRCFKDACPHRLAPLSEGRVEAGGILACSYHGWRFNGSGACTRIPQADDPVAEATACASQRSCAESYPVQVHAGLVWLWPDASAGAAAAAAAASPAVSAAVEHKYSSEVESGVRWYMRDLPYSYDILVENVTDPAHLPFSHHNLTPAMKRDMGGAMLFKDFGLHSSEQPTDSSTSSSTGYSAEASDAFTAGQQPACRFAFTSHMSPQGRVTFTPPSAITYRYELSPQHYMHTDILAVPTQPGRSRVFVANFSNAPPPNMIRDLLAALAKPAAALQLLVRLYLLSLPRWRACMMSNRLFDGDGVFLNMQERMLHQGNQGQWQKAYYMPTSADRAVIAARKWIDTAGSGGPFATPSSSSSSSSSSSKAGAAAIDVSRQQLLDRYKQHTQHCPHCKGAIKQLQVKEKLSQLAAAVLFLVLCGTVGTAGLAGLLAGGVGSVVAGAAVVGLAMCAAVTADAQKWLKEFSFVDFVHADND